MSEAQSSVLEKHIQTAILMILVGLCVWMANTIQTTSINVATTVARVDSLKEQVTALQGGMNLMYTKAEASRDLSDIRSSIQELRDRFNRFERRGNSNAPNPAE